MDRPRPLLKDLLFNRETVEVIACRIQHVHPEFEADHFSDEVLARFPVLELKARIAWITTCLETHLPDDFRTAAGVLLRSLPSPLDPSLSDGDFGDFVFAPYSEYVARHGRTAEDLDFSLEALREITTRFSAEYAIRPFLDAFPDQTLATLLAWTGDEHYHVRRLCSEGTRPRLPWATNLRLPYDVGVPILERLFDDRARYVTRSVANHVNDISKKDPELAVELLERWRDSGRQSPREMDYIVRHASRTLAKRGHPRALQMRAPGRVVMAP